MNRTLRIGIAGVAHPKAGVYAAALREIESAALIAVWDASAPRAQAFAAEYGAAHQTELSALVAQADALVIASETIHHPPIVASAARAGVPALCAPPLAATPGDARATIEMCEQAGTQLAIASPLRYHYSIQQLREAIQTGALGELLFIRAAGQGAYPGGWLADPVLAGGGALLDRAAPLVDLLRWIVGRDVRQVYAEAATLRLGGLVEDTALLLLTFDGGLSASLDPSWSRPAAYAGQGDLSIEIAGTNGVAHVDAFAQYVERFGDDRTPAERRAWGDDLDRLMLAGWLASLRAGSDAPVGAAEGLRALEIVLAAYRSAELRAPVLVHQ